MHRLPFLTAALLAATLCPAASARQAAPSDDALIEWLGQDNRAEIALAEFAMRKSQNTAVREFAERMVDTHRQFGETLDSVRDTTDRPSDAAPGRVAPPSARRSPGTRPGNRPTNTAPGGDVVPGDRVPLDAVNLPDAALNDGEPDSPLPERTEAALFDPRNPEAGLDPDGRVEPDGLPETSEEVRAAQARREQLRREAEQIRRRQAGEPQPGAEPAPSRTAAMSGGGADETAALLEFRRRVNDRQFRTLQQQFGALSPAEFDRIYVTQQVGAHLKMLDTLAEAKTNAGSALREVIGEGQRTVEEHLEAALALRGDVVPGG